MLGDCLVRLLVIVVGIDAHLAEATEDAALVQFLARARQLAVRSGERAPGAAIRVHVERYHKLRVDRVAGPPHTPIEGSACLSKDVGASRAAPPGRIGRSAIPRARVRESRG